MHAKECACDRCRSGKCRRELAKELQLTSVPDRLWVFLVDRGEIDDVLIDPDSWRRFVEVAESSLAYGRDLALIGPARPSVLAGGHRPADDPAPALLGDYDRSRAEAVADALADLAADDPGVRRFRQEVLSGGVLTPDHADAFVASPALAVFKPRDLADWGIPMVGHRAQLERSGSALLDGGEDAERVAVYVHPPGELKEKWFSGTALTAERARRRRTLAIPRRGGGPGAVRVWPNSTLDDLRRVAEKISKRHMWREADATWFVLTGTAPPVPAIRSSYRAQSYGGAERATITLDVEPWVSHKAVTRVYREWQRRIKPGRERSMPRRLAVFRFVAEKTRGEPVRPTWQALVDEWDRTNPEQSYKGNRRSFQRDHGAAKQALLFPFGWDGGTPSDPFSTPKPTPEPADLRDISWSWMDEEP